MAAITIVFINRTDGRRDIALEATWTFRADHKGDQAGRCDHLRKLVQDCSYDSELFWTVRVHVDIIWNSDVSNKTTEYTTS